MKENNLNIVPNNNKNGGNTGLWILIGLMICVILCLGGFIVYDKFIKDNEKQPAGTNPPTQSAPPSDQTNTNNECILTNFDKYDLTTNDKIQITNIINKDTSMGTCKIDDISSIKLEKSYGYYAHFSANTKCNDEDYEPIQILAYKVNDKFKVYSFGSGWLDIDEEILNKILGSMCK